MGWALSLDGGSLVDLRFAVLSVQLLLVDSVLNAILPFLVEDLLVLKELLLRSGLAVLLLYELRGERTVLELGINDSFALFLDTSKTSLLPLLESTIIVLLVFKFALW